MNAKTILISAAVCAAVIGVSGYCVLNADYRRGDDRCGWFEEPKKWLFYMDEPAEKET